MRPVFGAHVLIVMLFFIEIKASGMMLKIFTGKKSSKKEKNKLNALATSGLTTPSASIHNPTLDLHEYQPHLDDSSQNPISYSEEGHFEQLIQNFHKVAPYHSSPPSRIIQNDLIQHQEEEHPGQGASLLRRIKTMTKKNGRERSSADNFATSRAHRKSAATHDEPSLGQQALDLHEYSHHQSFEEASGKKGKSRKSEGNKAVLDYKKFPAPAGGGEHGVQYFDDKQPLTVDKLIRDRESFEHFQSFFKQNPPPAASLSVYDSGAFYPHQYVPPFVSLPEGHLGGKATYGYAAPPVHPNTDGHFGDSEFNGYAAPPYPSHSWDSGPNYGK